MEGIRDGAAVDHCYHCALLYPASDDTLCPRCENRMRYEPAAHDDAVSVDVRLATRIAAYIADRSRSNLEVLLITLHRYREVGAGALAAGPLSMDQLRADYESFGGSSKRHMHQLPTER